jgi:hypothetical protein
VLNGYQNFLILFRFSFHKVTFPKGSGSHFLFFEKFYAPGQGINIFLKIELVLTMLIFINLKTVGYHLMILTTKLLAFFSNKKSTKITNKLLISFLFLKVKKS